MALTLIHPIEACIHGGDVRASGRRVGEIVGHDDVLGLVPYGLPICDTPVAHVPVSPDIKERAVALVVVPWPVAAMGVVDSQVQEEGSEEFHRCRLPNQMIGERVPQVHQVRIPHLRNRFQELQVPKNQCLFFTCPPSTKTVSSLTRCVHTTVADKISMSSNLSHRDVSTNESWLLSR